MRFLFLLITLLLLTVPLSAQPKAVYLPNASHATTMGSSNNYYPFGHKDMHYQQIHDKTAMGGTNIFRFMQLRPAGPTYSGPNYGGFMLDMEMSIGETTVNYLTPSTNWATNNPNPVTVIPRQWVLMPILLTGNVNSWFITLPFNKPVPYSGTKNFIFEVISHGRSTGSGGYQLDAESSPTALSTRIWGTSTAPTSSGKATNYGLVIRLGLLPAPVPLLSFFGQACPGSTNAPLRHVCRELPHLGGNLSMGVADAQSGAPLLLTIGNRRTSWGPFPLPFDLTNQGAPGCYLNSSVVLAMSKLADPTGNASIQLTVPNTQTLKGNSLYMQWYAVDQKANALGMITSRSAEALVE